MNKKGDIKIVVGILLILICVLSIILWNSAAMGAVKKSLVGIFGSEEVLNREQVNAESKSVLSDIETAYNKCKSSSKTNCVCEGNSLLAGLYEEYNLVFEADKVSLIDAEHNDMNIDHKNVGTTCYLVYSEKDGKYIPIIKEEKTSIEVAKKDAYDGKPTFYKMENGKICLILNKGDFDQYSLTKWFNNKAELLMSYLDSAAKC